ncbi:DUF6677 family protein [Granulicella paludicola]|jgi:hypothetical protein|uniref:DUF6677 family protein n=1 Tax=Granulicella paludicola TaxID=474951 RepID=UPI0021DFB362|nr:DUF6677 family protein [Granulicella paludicola]
MATPAPLTAKPLATKKNSSFPMIVLLAGWLVPGLGHLLVGKKIRALLLFAAIVLMYIIGISLAGKVYTPSTGDYLDLLGFVGQLGLGLLYVIARAFGLGAAAAVSTIGDYGTKALLIAGLLNVITAVDAHSLANGRKASF